MVFEGRGTGGANQPAYLLVRALTSIISSLAVTTPSVVRLC